MVVGRWGGGQRHDGIDGPLEAGKGHGERDGRCQKPWSSNFRVGQNQLGVEETCLKCRFLGLSPHIFNCPGLVGGTGEMLEGAQISHSTEHVCHVHTVRASHKRDARDVGKVGGPGRGAWKSRPQSEGMGPRESIRMNHGSRVWSPLSPQHGVQRRRNVSGMRVVAWGTELGI